MYNSLYVITILTLLLLPPNISSRTSNPSHCLRHFPRHQPSIGHYLLRIEYSINNEQSCEHKCSVDHRCSMATFNRHFHRCHLFRDNPKRLRSKSYRSNYVFSTYANCPGRFSFTNHRQKRVSTVHCNYDSLPWQHARRLRSLIFQSYTLIGISYVPCQELCTSVRHCAGIQFQVRGLYYNRCQLLRSTKPWDLLPSKDWTVFAKRSCYVQVTEDDLFSRDNKPLCSFKYFGQGHYRRNQGMIHRFSHTSETQCQYICSKLVHCIGVEFVERRSQCILLSSNFLRHDGLLDMKTHSRHHIYLKLSCDSFPLLGTSHLGKCSINDIHCGCHQSSCQHGTCLSQRREGYYYMFCSCYQGFTGHSCEQEIENFCPCLNGGICQKDQSECQCSNGYSGEFCQIISETM